MLKTISVSALALAVVGFAAPAMAVNPWAPLQTTVPVTVTVQEMTELWTDYSPVPLSINDAGLNGGSNNDVARSVAHLSNVDVDISVAIDDHIPTNTSFWVLINPPTTWSDPPSSGADNVIEWRRDGAVYGTNKPTNAGGVPVAAFSAAANPGLNANFNGSTPALSPSIYVPVSYFATAWNYMPAVQTETFNVVWTIAASP